MSNCLTLSLRCLKCIYSTGSLIFFWKQAINPWYSPPKSVFRSLSIWICEREKKWFCLQSSFYAVMFCFVFFLLRNKLFLHKFHQGNSHYNREPVNHGAVELIIYIYHYLISMISSLKLDYEKYWHFWLHLLRTKSCTLCGAWRTGNKCLNPGSQSFTVHLQHNGARRSIHINLLLLDSLLRRRRKG